MEQLVVESLAADHRFPVRLRLFTPEFGFGEQLGAMMAWLHMNCGRDRYTLESNQAAGLRSAVFVYFSDPVMAAEFSLRFDNGRMIGCEPEREPEHAKSA
jgi:hypothetical protein